MVKVKEKEIIKTLVIATLEIKASKVLVEVLNFPFLIGFVFLDNHPLPSRPFQLIHF